MLAQHYGTEAPKFAEIRVVIAVTVGVGFGAVPTRDKVLRHDLGDALDHVRQLRSPRVPGQFVLEVVGSARRVLDIDLRTRSVRVAGHDVGTPALHWQVPRRCGRVRK